MSGDSGGYAFLIGQAEMGNGLADRQFETILDLSGLNQAVGINHASLDQQLANNIAGCGIIYVL
jgi:hypothetical protein